MDELSTFERQVAAALDDYAGPRRPVDAAGITSAARDRAGERRSLADLAAGVLPVPVRRRTMPTTMRIVALAVLVALATTLLMFGVGAIPTPRPPASRVDGSIAVERFAAAPWSDSVPPREVVLVARDGTVTPITPPNREEGCATFSPDGSRVALLSAPRRSSGTPDPIFELAVTGIAPGSERSLLAPGFTVSGLFFLSAPSWAPDGSAVVAVLRPPDDPSLFWRDLVVVPVDGSPPRTLIRAPRVAEGEPLPAGIKLIEGASWSPDGNWIAFRGEIIEGAEGHYFVAVIRPDGSDLRVLTTWSSSGEWGGVAWSPDSRSVAYHRRGVGWDVYVVNLEDSVVRSLSGRWHERVAEWSPDGGRIATLDITQVIDVSTGSATRVNVHTAAGATWSAHGDRLAIVDDGGRLWRATPEGEAELVVDGLAGDLLCGATGPGISWQEVDE